MRHLLLIIAFLTFSGNVLSQDIALAEDNNFTDTYGILSFRPMDMMTEPHQLSNLWLEEAIPLDLYSEKEKTVQKVINTNVADAIVTYSPIDQGKEWIAIDYEDITPYTWKWVDLELPREDGTLTKINLRRPHWWLKKVGATAVGSKVYMDLPEMGSVGWAKVTAIRVNQLDTRLWEENRQDDFVSRPVTGKFEHESNEVFQLYFQGQAEPLGVTGLHPIWSLDRNAWVGAGDLQIGEQVKTREGKAIVKSKEKLEGNHKVYNIEVFKDHNFLVGTNKILVHNNCIFGKGVKFRDLTRTGKIDPSQVRFSQNSIKGSFKNGGNLNDFVKGLKNGNIDPSDIPAIRIVEKDGLIFTLDNRRLYSFQKAGIPIQFQKLDRIPKNQRFKFTTTNQGTSIDVRQ